MTYNLGKRTRLLGGAIVIFCKNLEQTSTSKPLITQLVRSGTSIGANYMEANGASSRRDFRNKIFICKKESQETTYWLQIMASAFPEQKDKLLSLQKESHELTLIFQKITTTLDKK